LYAKSAMQNLLLCFTLNYYHCCLSRRGGAAGFSFLGFGLPHSIPNCSYKF
jgi:hypothetical protein